MIVLGIESSCDETAAALVNDKKEILGEALLSQEEHKAFGGVVPEIAARSHLDHIDGILEQLLCQNRADVERYRRCCCGVRAGAHRRRGCRRYDGQSPVCRAG